MRNTLNTVIVNWLHLDVIGKAITRKLHEWVINSSPPVRKMVDTFHGGWLGHPLHPVLTDVTIGAWLYGSFFGVLSLIPGLGRLRNKVHNLNNLGTVSALFTALSGLADYSAIKREAVAEGTVHAGTNAVAPGKHSTFTPD